MIYVSRRWQCFLSIFASASVDPPSGGRAHNKILCSARPLFSEAPKARSVPYNTFVRNYPLPVYAEQKPCILHGYFARCGICCVEELRRAKVHTAALLAAASQNRRDTVKCTDSITSAGKLSSGAPRFSRMAQPAPLKAGTMQHAGNFIRDKLISPACAKTGTRPKCAAGTAHLNIVRFYRLCKISGGGSAEKNRSGSGKTEKNV